MIGVRESSDRRSSKLRRAARRLRKKGYTAQAGQMALAAEQVRLDEPTVMRPEHRALERQAQAALTESQRRSTQPDFDYARDIAPLRGEFFSTLAESGMTPSEQAGDSRRYTPQFSAFDKDQAAFLQLQEAQRKTREQRTSAGMAPVVAQHMKDVMGSKGSSTEKNTGLMNVMFENPDAFRDTTVQSMYEAATKSLTGDRASSASQLAMVNSFYKDLVTKGRVKEAGQLSPLVSPLTAYAGGIAGRANLAEKQRGEKLKELDDIDAKLQKVIAPYLTGGGSKSSRDAVMAAILEDKEISLPDMGDTGDVVREYLRLLYARAMGWEIKAGQPLADPELEAKFAKDSIELLVRRVMGVVNQRQSKQGTPAETAPSAAAQSAASGFGQ